MDKALKKDVTRRYNAMLRAYSGQGEYQGKVNCYTCSQCGQITKTIDIDNGVTPMGIECPYCHGEAMSSFYQDIAPNIGVTYEWYRPYLVDVLGMINKQFFTVNHILHGGLLRRPCEKKS